MLMNRHHILLRQASAKITTIDAGHVRAAGTPIIAAH
jgi:hypothetical protein